MVSHPNRLTFDVTRDAAPMTCERLEHLIGQIGGNVTGWPGFWEFSRDGRELVCVADEPYDRMRIMTKVADVGDISSDQLTECLEANFDRTQDARYCVTDGTVWSAFLHPLRSLTPDLFRFRVPTGT